VISEVILFAIFGMQNISYGMVDSWIVVKEKVKRLCEALNIGRLAADCF
jgi:hypothetical protein